MRRLNGASKFLADSRDILYVGDMTLFALLFLDAYVCIGFLLCTKGWRNYTLMIMLSGIFVYAGVDLVIFAFYTIEAE